MKVAIIGYSVEGVSAAKYWQDLGHEVAVMDSNPDIEVPAGVARNLGLKYLNNLDQYDLIVRSPGVKPSAILEHNPKLDPSKISSVMNEFLEQSPAKVIGVTGTKGKGTTSSLIAHILQEAGLKAWVGGNIGHSPLDFLTDIGPDDWVVLEMSSFQLMDIRHSPHVAVMLMMAQDHLNWHRDMDEYIEAKSNIFRYQQPGDRAIYNACNLASLQCGLEAPCDQAPYNAPAGAWVNDSSIQMGDTVICQTDQVGLPGRHNWDNICAAITAVWPIVSDVEVLKRALMGFSGLEHRIEKVAQINGVTYVNDSYSSSPGPTMAALEAFDQPKVLIMGGYDKHLTYDSVADLLNHVDMRKVILIGQIADQIADSFDRAGFSNYVKGPEDIHGIVQLAAKESRPGDVVILSPGTSSFDMFKNFKDRGERYKQAVKELADGV